MAQPTRELCADLVTYLAALAPPGPTDSYDRAYFIRTADANDASLQQLTGRRVRIAPSLPTAYSYEALTRGGDLYTHHISVIVEKRWPDRGDPQREWMDAEVDWVYENIVLGFDFDNRALNGPSFNRMVTTVSAEVSLFELDTLLRSSLFSSIVDITFNELVSA